jgi:transposase
VLAMDETPIKAGRKKNKSAGRGGMKVGYFWPIYGDRDEVAFPFADTRAHAVVYETLKEFCGTLLADGYGAYDSYAEASENVELANCWTHARRKFVEAEPVEPLLSGQALARIGDLYEHDARCRDGTRTPDEVRAYRQTHCTSIVDAFFASLNKALDERALLPTSPFTKAACYAVDRERSLRVFLEHPGVQMDTNHLERALRPIALGRKNWMFCSTEVGARQVGMIQSLLVTCKLHGLDTYTYLVDVLQRVQTQPAKQVRELTPRLWAEHFAQSPMRSALFSHSD